MDPAVDRGTKLIARNRELLAIASHAREAARAAIERAEDVVQITIEIRMAWALMRQKLADER